ncbi:hypothetical protein PSPO01_15680 [Paraphaeosphaeria sporulosa]
MLRPADCQSVSRYLVRSLQQGRPCLAGVHPHCVPSVPGTARQHSAIPPTNQGVSSFSAWI